MREYFSLNVYAGFGRVFGYRDTPTNTRAEKSGKILLCLKLIPLNPNKTAASAVFFMPKRAKSPCRYPGCGVLLESGSYCQDHKSTFDSMRGNSAKRGYDARWRKARESYLAEHPLCVKHHARGEVVVATVVDHIRPHRGNKQLFWDEGNWQALCKQCHDIKTATEDGGFGRGG